MPIFKTVGFAKHAAHHVRNQHGKRALKFTKRFQMQKTKFLQHRLQREIRTAKKAMRKNAEHIDLVSKTIAQRSDTAKLLEKNERLMAEVLLILRNSLDD